MIAFLASIFMFVSSAAPSVDVSPTSLINDLIVTGPIAGVMLWLYFDERKERRSLQTQLIDLVKTTVPALEKSTNTLDKVVGTVDQWLTHEKVAQELGVWDSRRQRHSDREGDYGAAQ